MVVILSTNYLTDARSGVYLQLYRWKCMQPLFKSIKRNQFLTLTENVKCFLVFRYNSSDTTYCQDCSRDLIST